MLKRVVNKSYYYEIMGDIIIFYERKSGIENEFYNVDNYFEVMKL